MLIVWILLREFGFQLVEPVGTTSAERQVAPFGGERARHPGAQAGTGAGDEDLLASHPGSISTRVKSRPIGYLSSRDIRRSASTLPPVWHVGQY